MCRVQAPAPLVSAHLTWLLPRTPRSAGGPAAHARQTRIVSAAPCFRQICETSWSHSRAIIDVGVSVAQASAVVWILHTSGTHHDADTACFGCHFVQVMAARRPALPPGCHQAPSAVTLQRSTVQRNMATDTMLRSPLSPQAPATPRTSVSDHILNCTAGKVAVTIR